MSTTDADALIVTVNNQEHTVPDTIETKHGFLDAIGFTGREYTLYRIDNGDEIEISGPMFVFDGGDEFVVIPKYVNDG